MVINIDLQTPEAPLARQHEFLREFFPNSHKKNHCSTRFWNPSLLVQRQEFLCEILQQLAQLQGEAFQHGEQFSQVFSYSINSHYKSLQLRRSQQDQVCV